MLGVGEMVSTEKSTAAVILKIHKQVYSGMYVYIHVHMQYHNHEFERGQGREYGRIWRKERE